MPRLSPEAELERTHKLYEQQRQSGAAVCVIGVDEVGRGAVAGPLTVAAVALPLEPLIMGLDDSKRLTATRREELADEIKQVASAIGIAHIQPKTIDRIGMTAALRAAVKQAVEACEMQSDLVLIDGNPLHLFEHEMCIVKGDSKVACIAAASIIAKVTRDAMMVAADTEYPGYELALNKGYASPQHIKAIREKGLSGFHRQTFCQSFLQQQLF